MKLLIFAHIPPPHHGQAVMVKYLLNGLCVHADIEVFHVNAQLSDNMEDVGGIRQGKLIRLIGCVCSALKYRFLYGADHLYYIPAPVKKSAILRDWLIAIFLRPFFSKTIFHWHAFGLGHWASNTTEYPEGSAGTPLPPLQIFKNRTLENTARWLTRKLMSDATLSIVLTEYNRQDVQYLRPQKITVVPNGIPDPCSDFKSSVLPKRKKRLQKRIEALSKHGTRNHDSPDSTGDQEELRMEQTPEIIYFRCLFLSTCTEEKGLFRALDCISLTNKELANRNLPLRATLDIAGEFVSDQERQRFEERIKQPEWEIYFSESRILNPESLVKAVRYIGFVSGDKKAQLLCDSDCLLFMTKFRTEAQPVTIIESSAYGLPIICSTWRGIGEHLPPIATDDYRNALISCMEFSDFNSLRKSYEETHKLPRHIQSIEASIKEAISR